MIEKVEPLNLWSHGTDSRNKTKPRADASCISWRSRTSLDFKEAIGECLSKYATFTGRSRRSEYWWFGLFILILTLIPSGLAIATEGILGKTENAFCIVLLMGVASFGVVLWTIIPSLTVQTRRLHDVGRSGWWIVGGVAVGLLYPIAKSVVLGFEALDCDKKENY